jgi:hypothetical protein
MSDPDVDGRIILKNDLQELEWEDIGWTDKAQYRRR